MSYEYAQKVSGTGTAADGAVDATVIAAPGANKTIYLQHAVIFVTVGGADAGGRVALEKGVGVAVIWSVDACAGSLPLQSVHYSWGEPGYPLTANTLLNVTTSGDGTTEATGIVTATGIAL